MVRSGASLLAVLGGALLGAPAAAAQERIVAGPPNQYATPSVTIDQGERVTFTNLDAVVHDVSSRDSGPFGGRRFGSPLVDPLGTAPVAGTQHLTTGTYRFFCTVHPFMEGTLVVTSAGAPVPRPDGGADRTPPRVRVRILDSRLSQVRRRRALRVRVRTSERAWVRLAARTRRTRIAGGAATVTDTRTVRLRLSRTGRRAVARARRLRISVTARAADRAGNTRTGKNARTLR